VSRKRIVSPIFFSETVTAEKYQEIIMQFISLLNEKERYCWLQQDGAISHTANSTMEMLKQFSDDRKISKHL
jgi:ribonucleotide reductase beta subunit family protein with ferritin-like domain